MGHEGRFKRQELKFVTPRDQMDAIRDRVLPYTVRDPHSLDREDFIYTVRSTYFDTDDLRFYFEREDGLAVRKKLRMRSYNRPEDACPVFLEIKRKFGRTVFKERISLRGENVDAALDGLDPDPEQFLLDQSLPSRHTLDRFRYSMAVADLQPTVLITYEREAFLGDLDDSQRVTFDMNLRSLMHPDMDDLYAEDDLCDFLEGFFILELKFDAIMPAWMRWLTQWLGVPSGPFSKYCSGIDAWAPIAI